mmetsp:Transcript_3428/g.6214  ORF Transcript_3428/g.6214 Transcript_3428/m.6214 type:complete len:299 (-) Transcript_3428:721-1617(-)
MRPDLQTLQVCLSPFLGSATIVSTIVIVISRLSLAIRARGVAVHLIPVHAFLLQLILRLLVVRPLALLVFERLLAVVTVIFRLRLGAIFGLIIRAFSFLSLGVRPTCIGIFGQLKPRNWLTFSIFISVKIESRIILGSIHESIPVHRHGACGVSYLHFIQPVLDHFKVLHFNSSNMLRGNIKILENKNHIKCFGCKIDSLEMNMLHVADTEAEVGHLRQVDQTVHGWLNQYHFFVAGSIKAELHVRTIEFDRELEMLGNFFNFFAKVGESFVQSLLHLPLALFVVQLVRVICRAAMVV